jgi:uncharacterized protein (DUF924 family)
VSAPWQALLDWWFGADAPAAEVAARQNGLWFGYRAEQDAEARERFGELAEQALDGYLGDWARCPEGWLALLLLLDQLPRMIHRGTPRAFAGDARAQAQLERGLEQDWDRQLSAIQRVFCYLVLEHAEDPLRQDRAVQAFAVLLAEQDEAHAPAFQGFLDYAKAHHRVIARFGRFPHRNAILGRTSTIEELVFLAEPGSRF